VKDLIVFDLDGTLAESKSAIDAEMSALLGKLLDVARVAIISGGDFPQFQMQLVANLPLNAQLKKLSLLPTCGTKFYTYDNGTWVKKYSEDFTAGEKARITSSLEKAVDQSGFEAAKTWGEAIEDRSTQVTYSALGQQAPLDEKKTWDPDFAKRKAIKAILDSMLMGFSVTLGGSTSIDITKPGIDKAYGMHKLVEILGIPIAKMLFIGDALFPGGNDYPARSTGADCIMTRDPNETKRIIETIIACSA
jgi:phosphomannomutase